MNRILPWLPHLLTASRGVAGPVTAWLLLVADRPFAAFWVFILAALTDLPDGWLARRWGADPRVGAFIDPFSDKLLVGSAWLALWLRGWAPWWLVWPSLVRDAVVSALWYRGRRRGEVWEPNVAGQIMTSYEGTAIGILLFHGPWNGTHWPTVGVGVGVFGLALSVVSALFYLWRGPARSARSAREAVTSRR